MSMIAGALGWQERDDERDAQFVDMLREFRRSGGLAREAEVRMRLSALGSASRQAEICSDKVACFEWAGQLWLPWFQFDRTHMTLRPGPMTVVAELKPAFDNWALALWFVQKNLWIGGHRPIDLIDECLASVLGAARADRFIATC